MIRELLISTELFSLTDELLYIIENKPLYYYELEPGKKVISFFENINTIYYYVMNNLESIDNIMAIIRKNNTYLLVCTNELKQKYIYCFDIKEDDWTIFINDIGKNKPLNLNNNSEYHAFLKIFYKSQNIFFKSKGYKVKGRSIYTEDEDFTKKLSKSNNKIINTLQSYLHVYPGFEHHFKKINNDHYLHIKPKSTIIFDKDLYTLYNENIIPILNIKNIIKMVNLPIEKSGRFIDFISETGIDSLPQRPFKNMSFIDYAKFVYNLELEKCDAHLIILNVRSLYPVWYFTSELVFPNFSFRDLSLFDPEYVGNIISKMKLYSSKRANIIDKLRKQININIFNMEFKLGPLYTHIGDCHEIEHEKIKQIDKLYPFIKFKRPTVNIRNIYGNIIEIGEYTKHRAYPGDLLRDRNLIPLDVPEKISIKVICLNKLKKHAEILLNKIQEGFGNYPSFEEIFHCSLNIDSFDTVKDFIETDIYKEITSDDDCVLLFGPRVLTDPIETVNMYTYAEKSCLAQGVPAQFIADEPRKNPIYDGSLLSKSKKTNVLFGISLNILGKIGARIFEPSSKCTNQFLQDSTVLSYNIARIFEAIPSDLMNEKSPGDIVRKSIPLSAPIVIMNESGTEIIHQDVHEISNETALFSGSSGLRISNDIPKTYKNVLVHKDGPYHKKELDDLKQLQNDNRQFIPVSITTGNIPRLFQSIDRPELRAPVGLVFPLSHNDFLMATTLYTPSMRPEKVGWPNPIQIKIHDEILPKRFSINEKSRILYQIWVLTRTYLGTQIPTRRPLSIHYSNKMAEFLRKVGEREPEYFRKFKNKRNKHNYMPRMFL